MKIFFSTSPVNYLRLSLFLSFGFSLRFLLWRRLAYMASKLSLQIMVRNIFSDLPSYFLIIISKPGFIYLFPILLGFVRIYFCELILYDKYSFKYSPWHHRLQDVLLTWSRSTPRLSRIWSVTDIGSLYLECLVYKHFTLLMQNLRIIWDKMADTDLK